jgi:sulfatase modifying factor 1
MSIPNGFDWKMYICLNDDLKCTDEEGAISHYIKYGMNENRKYKDDFNNLSNTKKINILTVQVNDASNNPDINKLGRVDYNYTIGKYQITIGEYCAFLNAVASKMDTYELYNSNMFSAKISSGIKQTNINNVFIYTPVGPTGTSSYGSNSTDNRPITYVSFLSSIRFANWITNGQPKGEQNESTTENGSYKINIDPITGDITVIKNFDKTKDMYYLPTEDEWYKSAFYSPNYKNTGNPGYYSYATQSDDVPNNTFTSAVYPNGNNIVNYISPITGALTVTNETNIKIFQNYLTNVGAFIYSSSYYGTYDQNGNVWEFVTNSNIITLKNGSSILLRGGAWTSFYNFLKKSYTLNVLYTEIGSNAGIRLVKYPKTEIDNISYETVCVNNAKNNPDDNGLGRVDYDYYIGKYNITVEQYCAFLNAVASISDTYNLYNKNMGTDLNIAGINRSGKPGAYTYSIMNNLGDSSKRPITYITPFSIFRFANWLTNGQPIGEQNIFTTEDGSYKIINEDVTKIYDNKKDMYYLPTQNEWYKAAYYSPNYNNTGKPGYYLYATQTDETPSNLISDALTNTNVVNYVKGVNYCVTQSAFYDVNQNYLTDVGLFEKSKSYYGTYDQTGLVYNLLQPNGTNDYNKGDPIISQGGFWAGGSTSMTKNTSSIITETTGAGSDGARLVLYKKV